MCNQGYELALGGVCPTHLVVQLGVGYRNGRMIAQAPEKGGVLLRTTGAFKEQDADDGGLAADGDNRLPMICLKTSFLTLNPIIQYIPTVNIEPLPVCQWVVVRH